MLVRASLLRFLSLFVFILGAIPEPYEPGHLNNFSLQRRGNTVSTSHHQIKKYPSSADGLRCFIVPRGNYCTMNCHCTSHRSISCSSPSDNARTSQVLGPGARIFDRPARTQLLDSRTCQHYCTCVGQATRNQPTRIQPLPPRHPPPPPTRGHRTHEDEYMYWALNK